MTKQNFLKVFNNKLFQQQTNVALQQKRFLENAASLMGIFILVATLAWAGFTWAGLAWAGLAWAGLAWAGLA
jgi:hypothetical protein